MAPLGPVLLGVLLFAAGVLVGAVLAVGALARLVYLVERRATHGHT